jgi:hypothetical protein
MKLGTLAALASASPSLFAAAAQEQKGDSQAQRDAEAKKFVLEKATPQRVARAGKLVDSLEMAGPRSLEAHRFKATDLVTTKQQAFVNDGSIQSFVAGMDDQLRADCLNSTLLAQLGANKKFDRFNDADNWYKFYVNVLENIGWVIQNFDFTAFSSGGADFSVNKELIAVLLAICTGDEAALVQTSVAAINSLGDSDNRVVLFERSSHNIHQGYFQICAAGQSGPNAVMKVGGFKFNASQNVTRVLFFRFSSASSSFFKGTETVVLNNDIYSRVRQQIVDKLGSAATTFVANLDI